MTDIPYPVPPENKAVVDKVNEISGDNVKRCMQCGTCSAVCPMVESMGVSVRQGMHLLQFGRVEEVFTARIGETCAACHACTVRCPRDIDVARVYEAVRQVQLRQDEDMLVPEKIPAETLAEAPQIAFVSGYRKLTA